MIEKITALFNSEKGKRLYNTALETVKKEKMDAIMENGVLIGLSGGADSVMLLLFLYEYSRKVKKTNLLATHIHHMIRGEEADFDLDFSKKLALDLGVEFTYRKIDVPAIAREKGCGIEETARNERYAAFSDIISGRNDISAIAVAHNATDNLETMLFNIFRGSGIRGAAAIPPVRDNVIRPLIKIPKSDIVSSLDDYGIDYVKESTNDSLEYTRNYIRHEILPKISRITKNPEEMAGRLSDSLRDSVKYIDGEVSRLYVENVKSGVLSRDFLLSLPQALLSEFLIRFIKENGSFAEYTHVSKIITLLDGSDFSYCLPNKKKIVSREASVFICDKDITDTEDEFYFELKFGVNEFPKYNSVVIISDKIVNNSPNVYKIAIQRKFPFDIIDDGLVLRSKKDGDSYIYGGMTHKLKKLFCDSKIPPSKRPLVPIICDGKGVLWPIGFSPRDTDSTSEKYIYIAFGYKNSDEHNNSFYFKQNNNIK